MTTSRKLNLFGLLLLGILLLSGAAIYTAWQHGWVEYRLFASGPDGFQPTDQLPSAEDTTLLKIIFEEYEVPYKLVNHKLFVRRNAWLDQDIMGTCGWMFHDPEFLEERGFVVPSE
jgi:hypothetical protein